MGFIFNKQHLVQITYLCIFSTEIFNNAIHHWIIILIDHTVVHNEPNRNLFTDHLLGLLLRKCMIIYIFIYLQYIHVTLEVDINKNILNSSTVYKICIHVSDTIKI